MNHSPRPVPFRDTASRHHSFSQAACRHSQAACGIVAGFAWRLHNAGTLRRPLHQTG
jgi:hypothetical protein